MSASKPIVSALSIRTPFCRTMCATLTAVLALITTDLARGQTTERVNVSSSGEQANGGPGWPSVSGDGHFVAFFGGASNLVAGDTNGVDDVFIHDRHTGETTRVSVSSTGAQGDQRSGLVSGRMLTGDGRFVAFWSDATNLVPNDTNGTCDAFIHDRQTGETTRVGLSATGEQGNACSWPESISADGRFVAISSNATNLVPGGTNGSFHVYVHDRDADADGIFDEPGAINMTLVNVSSTGEQGNGDTGRISISGDGRLVAFVSRATNLVEGDTNGARDVFVHDLDTHQTTRVSLSSTGEQSNGINKNPTISADGRFVAFGSDATNLVSGDTNGERDIFVRDRLMGETTRVSISSAGEQGNGISLRPRVSADGLVVFASEATNLVSDDTNGGRDIFVHDRLTGETTRVNLSATGEQAADGSGWSSISANGRVVSFMTTSGNLVPGDTNGFADAFVRDFDGQTIVTPTIAFDGFESGDLSGGSGDWVDAWTASGGVSVTGSAGPASGLSHVQMRGSGLLERTVNLAGVTDARLRFWSKVTSIEDDERVVITVDDGFGPTTLLTMTALNSEDVYRFHEIDLSVFAMVDNFRVSFEAFLGNGNDRWFLDDIAFAGFSGPPQPGITVTPTAGLTTTEGGGTASFTVALKTEPAAAVTIDVSTSDATEGLVSSGAQGPAASVTLSFDATCWCQPQTVTVTGVDDTDLDGDIAYTIVTAPAVGTGLDAADVSVTNLDDEVPAGVFVNGIAPASMTVGTTVNVTITGSGFAAGASVTFENGSGKTPTATVTSVTSTTIVADVSVGNGGPRRPRIWDVRVTNPDSSTDVLTDEFTVVP